MNGYGVMGLRFRSGHVLAMRRFTASSIGPAYTSIWHRGPNGDWVFYTNVAPGRSCPRYFGANALDAVETQIELKWTGPFSLLITMPAVPLTWEVVLGTTAATRLMNAMGQALPDGAWRSPSVLTTMGAMAGPLLGVGALACRAWSQMDSASSPIRGPCGRSSRAGRGSREKIWARPAPCIRRPTWGTSGSPSAASSRSARRTSSVSTLRVTRREHPARPPRFRRRGGARAETRSVADRDPGPTATDCRAQDRRRVSRQSPARNPRSDQSTSYRPARRGAASQRGAARAHWSCRLSALGSHSSHFGSSISLRVCWRS